jgi:hypothetical protein
VDTPAPPLIRDGRDRRIDFFRGIALWWIFTDHIPADWLGNFSLRNYALCDATEVFVLLAGYAGGLAYGGTLRRQGWLVAAADVVRRAWILYIAHIFLFVVFAAQVGYSAATLDRADYLDEIHLDIMGSSPYRALLEALTLHFQPAYLNVLPLYVVVLLLFALTLPMLYRPRLYLVFSAFLYIIARVFDINLPSWTGGGWFFNPFCWQVLFTAGAVIAFDSEIIHARLLPGARTKSGRAWRSVFDLLALLMVLFGFVMQFVIWVHPESVAGLPEMVVRGLMNVDKDGLHPLRLMSIAAYTWGTARLISKDAAWLRHKLAAPFVLAGQHSLPVFCVGIFLSFLGRLVTEWNNGWISALLVNLAGAIGMVVVAAIAAWYTNKGRSPGRRAPMVKDLE